MVRAISGGAHGRIALTCVEWAGPAHQAVVVPRRLIEDARSAEAFAAELAEAPLGRERWTSISSALLFAAGLFEQNPFSGLRKVIDVSGDGPNDIGPPVGSVRDAVLARNIVVNGLPILLEEPNPAFGSSARLDLCFEDCAVGGPDSFVIPVRERDQFAPAIRRKLVLEVAGRTPALVPAALRPSDGLSDRLMG